MLFVFTVLEFIYLDRWFVVFGIICRIACCSKFTVIIGIFSAESRLRCILFIGLDIIAVTQFMALHINHNTGNLILYQIVFEIGVGVIYKIHHLIFFKNQFTVTGKIDRFVVIGLQGILPGKKHLMITVLINSRLILFFIGRSNFRFLSAV